MERALVEQVTALLFIAFAVGLLIRRFVPAVPYTVALLVVGIGLAFTGLFPDMAVTSQTILVVFLPALLFQAAINLDLEQLRSAVLPVALLAVVGVAITIAFVGELFAVIVGVPIETALLLAAIISATDPVAVLGVFRRLHVPKRLEMVVEGESLFNDGTALVAFQIALAMAASGVVNPGQAVETFLITVIGGLLLGAALGFAFSHLLALTRDHLLEMGISTVLAYGSYLLGGELRVSAVITVVVAGIVAGNYGRAVGFSERARVVVIEVWDYLAFIANSVLFLLIGRQLSQVAYGRYLVAAGVAIGLALLSRAAIVYGIAPITSRLDRHVPVSWQHLAFWGGLRGPLAVAMVLAVPPNLPYRDLLLAAVSAVVLFTILVQGLSLEYVVRWLKVRE